MCYFLSSAATAPRHLKKAWLQRHTTGEDGDNNTATQFNVSNTIHAVSNATDTFNKATNKAKSDNNSGKDMETTAKTTTTTTTHSITISSKHPINNSANKRSGKYSNSGV